MYRRWLWPGFALPGIVWLIVLFLVPFYAVVAVAFGTVDPILGQAVPFWNPLEWNVGWILEVSSGWRPAAVLRGRRAHHRLRRHRARPLAPDRLSRRLLHRPPCRSDEEPAPDPPDRSSLDQLPDADARVGEPPCPGRVREPVPHVHARARGAARLARRTGIDRDPRAGLRLHPVHDPAPLRRARPDRPEPPRGGARPRREPVQHLPARDPAACRRPASSAAPSSSLCRCSATTTRPTSSRARRRRR